jgi:hypothetical protein
MQFFSFLSPSYPPLPSAPPACLPDAGRADRLMLRGAIALWLLDDFCFSESYGSWHFQF